ncbi:hypothetical protein O6B72_02055 [Campylobacter ureolyticus]|uniref:hypothetical protein n=1 Tax=Campylobacter ureolyticus TaxID=827 RepID=UPI0022B332A4|nr:hypothetical protein [Campylobacter ureolyticus]MCZ6155603.1 hypothetical protein [Campylobacter ureolyticus]
MKIMLNKTKFLNSLNSNEKDVIKKAQEIFYKWAKQQEPCIFSEKEINENLNKAVKEIQNKTATLYTKEEIDKQIKTKL